jgi:hypothetical protein
MVELERNGTDWAEGRTEIGDCVGFVLDWVIWIGDRKTTCGGGVVFLLLFFGSTRREVSKDEVLDCTREHTVVRSPNTSKATECCGYLSDLFIHIPSLSAFSVQVGFQGSIYTAMRAGQFNTNRGSSGVSLVQTGTVVEHKMGHSEQDK